MRDGARTSASEPQPVNKPDRRAVHGGIFLVLWAVTAAIPACRPWPWLWLAPLAGYFALLAVAPPLRRSFVWLRAGRVDGPRLSTRPPPART